jgi:hypothetical protein
MIHASSDFSGQGKEHGRLKKTRAELGLARVGEMRLTA